MNHPPSPRPPPRPQQNNGPLGNDTDRFLWLMNEVADFIIFFMDPERQVTDWNAGAEQLLGYSAAEMVGQSADIIYTPEDRAKGDHEREANTAAETGRAVNERWHVRKDGTRFWGSGFVTAFRDDAGGLRGFCKIMRDLTERKRWETELQAALAQRDRVAETLQQLFLLVPPPGAFPGLLVETVYESASDDVLVGGDLFDIFAVAENKIALVVGDATGHGLKAVAATAEVKFALRAFLREYPQPAIALHRLNAFVLDNERLDPRRQGDDAYIAVGICVVDTDTHELTCSWAGIEPPFVVRAEGGAFVELLECNGPLMGMEARSEYREQRVALAVGDVLAMSTDGLTEARRGSGPRREFFGYERLVQAVSEEVALHPFSLADASAAVAQRAREFADGRITDDVCLLLARRTG